MSDDDLNTATDRLNESFEQLEGALTSLNLGVPARVELESTGDGRAQRLAFRKANARWKLMVERDDPPEAVDLSKTNRETRLQAACQVEALVLELHIQRDRELRRVLACTATVDALTRKLVRGPR